MSTHVPRGVKPDAIRTVPPTETSVLIPSVVPGGRSSSSFETRRVRGKAWRTVSPLVRCRFRVLQHGQHVVVLRDRPESAAAGLGVEVDGCFALEALEDLPRLMILEEVVVEEVDAIAKHECGVAHAETMAVGDGVQRGSAADPSSSSVQRGCARPPTDGRPDRERRPSSRPRTRARSRLGAR
jgi:hypothetical protein